MNNNRARSFMQVRRGRSKSNSRSKRGVSPVIGVILMVAATIVIAGVVMAMLGGFGPPKSAYIVTASASENATGYIYVTYNGGPDSAMVDYLNVTIDGTEETSLSTDWGTATGTNDVKVGASHGKQGTAGPNNNRVVVSATFIDGTTQVILDTWV